MEIALYAAVVLLALAAMALFGAKVLRRAGNRMLTVCPACSRKVNATSRHCVLCGTELASLKGKPPV